MDPISATKKLFGKKDKAETDQLPPGLSRAEQRQVRKIMERTAPGKNGIPQTAQESIPFERMFRDGTCRVTSDYYSHTIRFEDINYQLASDAEKEAIFEEWCDFLNFFDSSVSFEISFVNTPADAAEFEGRVQIPCQDDPFNDVRAEYTAMLKRQVAKGNNGLVKTKYLSFGIRADSLKQARPKLCRIEADLLMNFKRMGVPAKPLDGTERLRLMHDIFYLGDDDTFFFDWDMPAKTGLSVKDFIANALDFSDGRAFRMGGIYGAMSTLQIPDPGGRRGADILRLNNLHCKSDRKVQPADRLQLLLG